MARTEDADSTGPEYREHSSDFPLLEKLTMYVTENNPEVLKDMLLSKVSENRAFNTDDLRLLGETIGFMEHIHRGQQRKYNFEPAEPKPFITHTLATALMVYELMGEDVTAEALAVALLHDAIEDGEIAIAAGEKADGKQKGKRKIRKSDLLETGFSKRIADGVEALSNVRGEGTKRRKLSHEEYFKNIEIANANTALKGLDLVTIKACDRSTNLLDPFRKVIKDEVVTYQMTPGEQVKPKKKKTTFESRRGHIENTERFLYPLVANNPATDSYLRSVMALADLTCQRTFSPAVWRQQLTINRYFTQRKHSG